MHYILEFLLASRKQHYKNMQQVDSDDCVDLKASWRMISEMIIRQDAMDLFYGNNNAYAVINFISFDITDGIFILCDGFFNASRIRQLLRWCRFSSENHARPIGIHGAFIAT